MSYITNVGAGEGLIKVGSNIVPFVNYPVMQNGFKFYSYTKFYDVQ